jgi:hypothetical protein
MLERSNCVRNQKTPLPANADLCVDVIEARGAERDIRWNHGEAFLAWYCVERVVLPHAGPAISVAVRM